MTDFFISPQNALDLANLIRYTKRPRDISYTMWQKMLNHEAASLPEEVIAALIDTFGYFEVLAALRVLDANR